MKMKPDFQFDLQFFQKNLAKFLEKFGMEVNYNGSEIFHFHYSSLSFRSLNIIFAGSIHEKEEWLTTLQEWGTINPWVKHL